PYANFASGPAHGAASGSQRPAPVSHTSSVGSIPKQAAHLPSDTEHASGAGTGGPSHEAKKPHDDLVKVTVEVAMQRYGIVIAPLDKTNVSSTTADKSSGTGDRHQNGAPTSTAAPASGSVSGIDAASTGSTENSPTMKPMPGMETRGFSLANPRFDI